MIQLCVAVMSSCDGVQRLFQLSYDVYIMELRRYKDMAYLYVIAWVQSSSLSCPQVSPREHDSAHQLCCVVQCVVHTICTVFLW